MDKYLSCCVLPLANKIMNLSEFQRLRAYAQAKRHAPQSNRIGRRLVKGRAKGCGAILRRTIIKSENWEKQPFQRPLNGTKGY